MLPVPAARLGGGDQGAQQWQCLLGRGLAGLFGLGDAGQFPERVLVHRWKTLLQIMAAASNLQPAWRNDSPAQLAERKGAFKHFEEVVLDDCGHMMHHDQPARLAAVIERFLAPAA